jgi:RimJ/RimL family protein N-acetyltransferase
VAVCELTLARWEEVAAVMEIIRDGRAFQRQQGFVQWDDTHPTQAAVEADIRRGDGYAIRVGGVLAGYLCLSFDGDPAYPAIEGVWRFGGDYAVIHRMAIGEAYRGRGLTGQVFRLAGEIALQKGVEILRIDTHRDNLRMRHVLEKHGFVFCGTVVQNGGERLAFDKKV